MVDLTITPANVVLSGTGQNIASGQAGETIAAGKAVYLDSTLKKWMLADSNSATTEARKAIGVALNGASLNQPVDVVVQGAIVLGATLVAGTDYYLSDTPGGICPRADIGSGEFVCLLGFAASTTVLNVDVEFPNVSL